MDNFNDFYNKFIVAQYGVNILNYSFFLAVFFGLVAVAILLTLLKYKNQLDLDYDYTQHKVQNDKYGGITESGGWEGDVGRYNAK